MSGSVRLNYPMKGKNRSYGKPNNYRTQIEFGAKGFFVTVDGLNHEKPAVREFYNLFSMCYSGDDSQKQSDPTGDADKAVDAADELALALEATNDQTQQRGNNPQGHLRQIPTNVKNCLFFQTDLLIPDVYSVAYKIIEKCQKENYCRFIARCMPVDNVTATETGHFATDMEKLIHYHMVENWKDEKPPTYALEFKARNNTSLSKQEVLMVIDERIRAMAPLARVNLASPDLSILVNVLHKNVLLSCVRGYNQLRKCSTRPKEENEPNKKTTSTDVESTVAESVET